MRPAMLAAGELVFAYGSLVASTGLTSSQAQQRRGQVCELVGFRRVFGVAMDNARTLPGYKYYVAAQTGERPAVQVAFLDLVEDAAASVNGLLLPFSASELAALARRERNYVRVEVTDALRPRPAARAWTFVGSDAGRERFEAGRARGTLVVARAYAELVEQGFEALGHEQGERYRSSTAPPPCPLVELERVEVPPAAAPATPTG